MFDYRERYKQVIFFSKNCRLIFDEPKNLIPPSDYVDPGVQLIGVLRYHQNENLLI